MATTNDLTIDMYRNPLNLQKHILDRFEQDGSLIVDPNNVVAYTIGMFSDLTAGVVDEIVNTTEGLYPKRAQTSEDLYKHMSDYDYVGLFSSPASCQLVITLDRNYVLENAVLSENGNYHKVVIPRNTVFTIGDYNFGLYYPIEVRVNRVSRTFSAVQDVSSVNPIHVLTKNILEHRFFQDDNVGLMAIKAPCYQFTRTVENDEIIINAGFRKKISYTDKFYAVRIFTNILNSKTGEYEWGEPSQVLSNQVYDPYVATAIVNVYPELQQVEIIIPQIYLTEHMVRGAVKIEVFTTLGALEFSIPVDDQDSVDMNFLTDDITESEVLYSEPLRHNPLMNIRPLNTEVTGGSDGYTFEELRTKVINNSFSDQTPITEQQVKSKFGDNGFKVTKYRDGITDRIFICHQKISDGITGSTLAAAALNTYFDTSMAMEPNPNLPYNTGEVNKKTATIIQHHSSLFTILPSTLYKFNETKNACIPLTNAELKQMTTLTAKEIVDTYNNNVFTLSPFHVQIDTGDIPLASSYDLTNPEVTANEFIGENTQTSKQLSLYNFMLQHVEQVQTATGGWRLVLCVSRTDDLKQLEAIDPKSGVPNFRVLVAVEDVYDNTVYAEASYQGRVNDMDYYYLDIQTDYQFGQYPDDDHVDSDAHSFVCNYTFADNKGSLRHPLYLKSKYHVVLALRYNQFDQEELEGMSRAINTTLPGGWNDYYALSEQRMELTLGVPVGNLWNRITLAFQGKEYMKYDTTKFSVTEAPVYRRDSVTGALEYTIDDNGKLVLHELYPKGTLTMVALTDNKLKPTFDIKEAYSPVVGGDSEVNGGYNSLAPSQLKSLSTIDDIWDMDRNGQGSSKTETWRYRVRVVDALGVIIGATIDGRVTPTSMCLQFQNMKTKFPSTGTKNQFIWVADARLFDKTTGTLLEPFVCDAPVYGLVKTDYEGAGEDDRDAFGRLYMWTDQWGWKAVIGGISLQDMKNKVNTDNTRIVNSNTGEITKEAYFHGYAYAMILKKYGPKLNSSGNVVADEIDLKVDPDILKYVSFLGEQPALADGEEPTGIELDYPCFTMSSDPAYTWENRINKWPWDIDLWYRVVEETPIEVEVGSSWDTTTRDWVYSKETKLFKKCFYDETINVSLNTAGLSSYFDYVTGQIVLDADGNPVIDNSSTESTIYLVNMMHLDAKLSKATTSSYEAYPKPVRQVLRSYFTLIDGVRNELMEVKKLFFEPIRSIGSGKFKDASGNEIDTHLDITMSLRVYVSNSAASDSKLTDLLKWKVIEIIDKQIENGSLNCVQVGELLKAQSPDVVRFVDVLGINGDMSLQTLICSDDNVRPHLKHELLLLEDGTVDVNRGIHLEIIVTEE